MENASKALIIAGAILLSILLISLGIMVYNNAKGTISDANLDSETVQAFNTKITQYCGTKKNGTTMNSLMDAIAASNGAQKGNTKGHYISFDASKDHANDSVSGIDGASKTENGKFKIVVTSSKTEISYPVFDNSHTYNATYTTDANGYINLITITN